MNAGLCRVVDVNKFMAEIKFLHEVLSQGLYPVPLCRMMAGSEIMNPCLSGNMGSGF